MKKLLDSKEAYTTIEKGRLIRRLCAVVLAITILFSAMPSSLGETYSETYLSLYYADATMAEGNASKKNKEKFFSSIAAISMADIKDKEFFSQLSKAVDKGYKCRFFVMHEKGMPATDLAILYCFEDSSWLLKDTTNVYTSRYIGPLNINPSLLIMDGLNYKLKHKALIKQVMPNCDGSYECDAKYVCQIYMEFLLFIEERNKAIDQLVAGASDYIPELPEEIDGWPLELPISVQLPKELTILDAVFTVEPAGDTAATFEQISDSRKFDGTVDADNMVSGTLLFHEAGPHLVRLVFTASIEGQKQSLSHDIAIDTSNVRVPENDICPLYGPDHQWTYEWADEHPHYGRFVCKCGAVMEDPTGASCLMPDCCACGFHDWTLAYYPGYVVGTCRRCGIYKDVTNSMPDYIRDYVKLLAEIGEEGNTYFDEHDTGKTFHLKDTAPWVYISNQALNRYTDMGTVYKEALVNTLAEPVVGLIELCDGEYEQKLNIESKIQLLWIKLIQEMITDGEQDVSVGAAEDIVDWLDIGMDFATNAYDVQTEGLKSIAEGTFNQSLFELEKGLQSSKEALENLMRTSTDSSKVYAEYEKVSRSAKELEAFKKAGPDYTASKSAIGSVAKNSLPYIMNAISALLEGMEEGEKVKEMRAAYINMLNDYDRSRSILDAMKEDAKARKNKGLEKAIDTIIGVLNTAYQANLEQYFDATVKMMDSMGEMLPTAEEAQSETFWKSFGKKSAQTLAMTAVDAVAKCVATPLTILSISAKILKAVSNYDEIFDASLELTALSSMRSDSSISLYEYTEQVSPYTLALYAKLESEGCEKAAEFVSTLSSDEDVDNSMHNIILSLYYTNFPAMAVVEKAAESMDVDLEEFGIGNDERETVVNMLKKEKKHYDEYARQCLQNVE